MNENKKEKTTLFQRERSRYKNPAKTRKKEEVRKVRPVTLASSYSPSPLTHHVTHEIPSQLTTQGRKKNSDTQQLRRVRGVFHLKVARRGRKKGKINSPSGDAIASS